MQFNRSKAIPDGMFHAVGIIAATWSFVEYQIQRAITELIGVEDWKGMFLLDNLGFHSRMHLLQTLANSLEEDYPDTATEFKALNTALDEAYAIRNKYVHSYWLPAKGAKEDAAEIRTIRIKGRIRIQDEFVTLKDAEADADEIWETAQAFTEFLQNQGFLHDNEPAQRSPEPHP